MRWHETTLGLLLAVALLATSCRGASDDIAESTPVPVPDPTATIVVEPTPTTEPAAAPAASDQDLVDAVVEAFDAAIEVGDAPEGLIAYDVLGSTVDEDGDVTLNICGWTGDSVFDTVRDSLWRTSVDAGGAVTASHVTTPVAPGECLNSHLIETALATVEEFDAFLIDVDFDPASFPDDNRSSDLLGSSFREFLAPVFDGFVNDGVYYGSSRRLGPTLNDLAAELLWRRYTQNNEAVIQFVYCRPMLADRGLYRDGVLIDDGKEDGFPGLHSIDALQLQPDLASEWGWRAVGHAELVWSDCSIDDWANAASRWQEAPTDFQVLEQ